MPLAGVGIAGDRPDVESDRDALGRSGSREHRFGVALGVIALVGLVARVAYVVRMRNDPIGVDGLQYHFRARALADGLGLVDPWIPILTGAAKAPPDAHNPPAWSLLLAGPTKLGLGSILSQQLFACVIGSATIVMTGLGGRAAFGRRAGLIAAGLVAVYPNVWLYERELMPEPLALFGVATCIWVAYRFLANPSPRLAFALGATVGLLAMTRSEQIALLPFLVLPLIMSAQGIVWRRRVGWLALAGIACALLVAPWTAYNTTRFDRPVVLSTGLGATMKAGNCDLTYSGERLGYYQVGIFKGCNVLANLSSDPSIADGQQRRAAIEFMGENRSRVPVVVAARIGRTFNVFRPFQQVHFEAERNTSLWVLRLGLFTYWMLVPLAVLGAVIARHRKIPIYPLLAFPVVVVLSVAFTIGAVRYRAPAEIPLALLAAFAIDVVTNRRQRGVSSRETSAKPKAPKLLGTRC